MMVAKWQIHTTTLPRFRAIVGSSLALPKEKPSQINDTDEQSADLAIRTRACRSLRWRYVRTQALPADRPSRSLKDVSRSKLSKGSTTSSARGSSHEGCLIFSYCGSQQPRSGTTSRFPIATRSVRPRALAPGWQSKRPLGRQHIR